RECPSSGHWLGRALGRVAPSPVLQPACAPSASTPPVYSSVLLGFLGEQRSRLTCGHHGAGDQHPSSGYHAIAIVLSQLDGGLHRSRPLLGYVDPFLPAAIPGTPR